MTPPRSGATPTFWIATAAGWAAIAFGVFGLVGRVGADGALDVGIWVMGGNLAHDVVIAPVAFAAAAGIARSIRQPWRAPLIAGLSASAFVVAVAYPALRGFGRKANNPTVLPLDYTTATLTVLAVVWVIAAAWLGTCLAWRRLRQARTTRATDDMKDDRR